MSISISRFLATLACSALFILLLLGHFFMPTEASASGITMLPPMQMTNSALPCAAIGAGTHQIIAWDGVTPMRCASQLTTTGNGVALTYTGSIFTLGKWAALAADRVLTNLTVYGTIRPISGFVLPTMIPAAPIAGQMWLDTSVVVP